MPERNGVGRRLEDEEWRAHQEQLDGFEKELGEMDREVHKQSGWLKTAAVVLSVSGVVLGGISNQILTKLTAIETMLNKTDVSLARHEERLSNCEKDIKEIQERHKYLDQNGVVIKKGNR